MCIFSAFEHWQWLKSPTRRLSWCLDVNCRLTTVWLRLWLCTTELWKRMGLYGFYVGRIVRSIGRTLELLELGKWSKMAVLRVLFDTSAHFVRFTEPRYVCLLPAHVAHVHDAISYLGPWFTCLLCCSSGARRRIQNGYFACFCNPDPSRSNGPRHYRPCICSRGMSHVHMMWNCAFGRCVFASSCDSRSGSGPTWQFRVYFTPPPNTSRDLLLSQSRYVYSLPRHVSHSHHLTTCVPLLCQVLSCTPCSARGPKWLFCVFFIPTSKHFSRSTASSYAYLLLPHVPHIDGVMPCVALPSHHFGVDQQLPTWSEIVVLRVFQIK